MKKEIPFEVQERRRRNLRHGILLIALLFSSAGIALLAVPPDAPMEVAVGRAFWGMGLLVGGFIIAALTLFVN
jgi:hypothetical protein